MRWFRGHAEPKDRAQAMSKEQSERYIATLKARIAMCEKSRAESIHSKSTGIEYDYKLFRHAYQDALDDFLNILNDHD